MHEDSNRLDPSSQPTRSAGDHHCPPRIMIVAMQSSIHVARWLRQIEGAGFEVVVFPVLDAPVHPLLRNVTVLVPELVESSAPSEDKADHPGTGRLNFHAICRSLAHLLSRRAGQRVEPDVARSAPPATAPARSLKRAWRFLGEGPSGGAHPGGRLPYMLRHPGRALRGAAAIIRYGDPQMRTPHDARRTPLILRYPRRALVEAANIVRFGQPNPPWHPRQPANLAPKRRQQSQPTERPDDDADDDRLRFVPLRLTLAQIGRDPHARTEAEPADLSALPAEAWFGPRMLAEAITRFRPDLIHSMEFQRCAYLVLAAKECIASAFPKWLASNWGSDIHHFAKLPDHRRQIVRVLADLDGYAAECERDVALARDLGYAGSVFPVVPNSGGFDLGTCANLRAPGPASSRRAVIVKGYQHFVGRALTALQVIARNADLLGDYDVVVYSATPDVIEAAREIARMRGIKVTCLPRLSHKQMLAQFGRARIYIGLSESDAISTGVLEAMVMGAFPIQTDTSCCNEWFADGEGGFIVNLASPEIISARFREALQNDALVDRAATLNWETAQRRLDIRQIGAKVVAAYNDILHGEGRRTSDVATSP